MELQLSENIRRLRQQKNLSRSSQRLQASFQTVSKWERAVCRNSGAAGWLKKF